MSGDKFRAIDGGDMPKMAPSSSDMFDQQVQQNEARTQEQISQAWNEANAKIEQQKAYDRALYVAKGRTVNTNLKLLRDVGYGFAAGWVVMALGLWIFGRRA